MLPNGILPKNLQKYLETFSSRSEIYILPDVRDQTGNNNLPSNISASYIIT